MLLNGDFAFSFYSNSLQLKVMKNLHLLSFLMQFNLHFTLKPLLINLSHFGGTLFRYQHYCFFFLELECLHVLLHLLVQLFFPLLSQHCQMLLKCRLLTVPVSLPVLNYLCLKDIKLFFLLFEILLLLVLVLLVHSIDKGVNICLERRVY